MKTIVLTFDRLAVRFLGCYGSDWVETPNFDLVASQSVLFENHFVDDVEMSSANHAWWSGRSSTHEKAVAECSPLGALGEQQISLHAVVAENADAPPFPKEKFHRVIEVASDEELFEKAIVEIDDLEKEDSRLLWLKSVGIAFPSFPCDESLELFLEQDDLIDAAEIVSRFADWMNRQYRKTKEPRISFHEFFSTDEERMLHSVYAACVYELDFELGRLWERIQGISNDDLLILIAGARGEWLGEPLPAAHPDCKVCESLIHTPFLMSQGEKQKSVRRRDFVGAVDLLPTIFDWFDVPALADFEGRSLVNKSGDDVKLRSHYYSSDHGKCFSIGSQEFFLRTHSKSVEEIDAESCELYHQPEDVWHVNDVGNQWPDRREELLQKLVDFKNGIL